MASARWMLYFCTACCFAGLSHAQSNPALNEILKRHHEIPGGVTVVDCEPCSSSPGELVVSGGSLYFSADDGIHGRELWRYDADGQARMAINLGQEHAGSSPTNIHALRGGVVFKGLYYLEAASPVWWIFSLPSGSGYAYNLAPSGGSHDTSKITVSGDWAYFDAVTPEYGREMWVTDGTPEGTRLTADTAPGAANGVDAGDAEFYGDGSIAYLSRANPGRSIGAPTYWSISPPSFVPEPIMVEGDFSRVAAGINFGHGGGMALVSGASPDLSRGIFLLGDALSGGTYLYASEAGKWEDAALGIAGSKYYMVIGTKEFGAELYVSKGKPGDARLLKDIWPGPSGSGPHKLTEVGERVYFAARDMDHGMELWTSDGTEEGTRMVVDMVPGPANANPYSLFAFDGDCFFSCEHPSLGEELWRTDGTEEGTRLVRDINPGPGNSEPYYLAEFNGRLFFAANDGVRGEELWSTDGTEVGTRLEADIMRPARREPSGAPEQLTAFNGAIYFSAQDREHGRELWCATTDDAELVVDQLPGPKSSEIAHMCVFGERLHFDARKSDGASAHFESDGTREGTRETGPALGRKAGPTLESLVPEPVRAGLIGLASDSGHWCTFGDIVAFAGESLNEGWEPRLWMPGMETVLLVADHMKGVAGSFPSKFTATDEGIYYTAEIHAGLVAVLRIDPTDLVASRVSSSFMEFQFPQAITAAPGGVALITRVGMARGFTYSLATLNLNENHGASMPQFSIEGLHTAPTSLCYANGAYFYDFYDPIYGRELWVKVAHEVRPRLVRDIYIGNPALDEAQADQRMTASTRPPVAPGNPGGFSPAASQITWTWTDQSDNEIAFKIYTNAGTEAPGVLSVTTPDNISLRTVSGYTANNVYSFQVAASNADGDSAKTEVITRSTRIQAVIAFQYEEVTTDSITAAPAGAFAHLDEGGSGIQLSCVETGQTSGFVQSLAAFRFTNLAPNTAYTIRGISRNRDGVESQPYEEKKRTLAARPMAPVLSNPTVDTLDIAIAEGDGNPSGTQYALLESGSGLWVQTNGTLGAAPVFRQTAAWATTTISSLAPETAYAFRARARNSVELIETEDGPEATLSTLAAAR